MTYYGFCATFVLFNICMLIWFSKMSWYFINTMSEAEELRHPFRAKLMVIVLNCIVIVGIYRLFFEQNLIPILDYADVPRLLEIYLSNESLIVMRITRYVA